MKNKILLGLQIAAIIAGGHFIAYQICHIPKQIELIGMLGFVLLYPILRYPMVGIYSVFILAPFIPFIRRLYYLAHGRPGTDPLIIIGDIIIIMVFAGVFFEFREFRPDDSSIKTYMKIIACYLIYMIIRTFVFNICPISENIARLKYYAPAVLLFFVGILYARNFSHLKRLWALTIAIALLSSVYGFKQLYIGYSSAEKLWFSSIYFTTLFIKGIARPFSFFQSPASFADYLQIGIIGVLMYFSWGKAKSKLVLVLLVPILFYGILITSVRSNWIGAAAAFFFWFFVLQIKNISYRIAVIVATVLVFFVYQFVDDSMKSNIGLGGINTVLGGKLGKQEYIDLMVTSRTTAITNPFEEHSMLSRITLWKYMFLLSVNPEMAVLGRGLGTLNADSLYITYLAEFGYPGFIFIIGIIGAFVMRGMKMTRSMSDGRAIVLAKGIICIDMSFALMSITGTHINSFPGDVYFWFWNGVLLGLPALERKMREEGGQV